MRQIIVDELSALERDNLDSYLKRTLKPSLMEGVFRLPLPPDLLSETQHTHESCGPFHFPIILEKNYLSFELLVRGDANLHCDCIAYATPLQRQFLLDFIDRLIDEERIKA